MIRVDTAGLKEEMKPLGFAKATTELEREWEQGSTAQAKDTDTDIPLYLPGFESARFKNLWTKINRTLVEKQYGKCAYCEAKMVATSSADVEHFRPKAGYDPSTGGLESAMLGARGLVRSGYFWLAYSSSNYYAACRICNEVYKKNKFDLMPNSPRATFNTPAVELPAFIDPGQEDPRAILRYDPYTARAVPAALWDDYLKRKGKEDPLATPKAQIPSPLTPQLQQQEHDRLQKVFAVLWNSAKIVCEAGNTNDAKYFFADQISRAAGVDRHVKSFPTDSPIGTAPYKNFGEVATEILSKGPGLAIEFTAIAWLHEVDPTSPDFVMLTGFLASKIDGSNPNLGADARKLLEAIQRTWIIPFAQQVVISNPDTSRAFYSIVHLGLNRTELVRARAEHLVKIRGLFLFLKNNGLIRGNLEKMLTVSFGTAPATAISDNPDELDAALTSLSHAVSNAGQFASATLDALTVWRLELPEAVPTTHQILISVNAPAEPWLARYYAIANQPLRPDSEDEEDESDDEDGAEDPTAADPSMQKLTAADSGYFCALQRFGVKLAAFRRRYALTVEDGDLLTTTVLQRSIKADQETEVLHITEVRRLLAFHAWPEDIVRNSFVPAWSKSDVPGYWAWVDKEAGNLNKELETACRTLAADSKSKYVPVILDKPGVLAWWRKAYPKKKSFPPALK
ncbi:MAG: hypothetical protein ACKV2U_01635 [Bryobacteraceae bacterium]